jgi:small subunit ribosomal protein S16
MALAIRMSRGGRANLPFYRIVVADKRYPRDGKYLEKLGTYDPRLPANDEKRVVLNKERLQYWLGQGAKPSDRVQRFLAQAGLMEFPKWNETPKKSAPKTKAQERAKEKAEKAAAAEEAAKAPKEEAAPVEEAAAPTEAPAVDEVAPAEAEAPAAEPAAEA